MKVTLRTILNATIKQNSKVLATGFAIACLVGTTSTAFAQQDNIVIPPGADGVTITNPQGGSILATGNAIRTSADTEIQNAGLIDGGVNGVNFVNGLGSGILTNQGTGVIQSDSRAVNIGGSVILTNQGLILGTGDQRNGTVYSDSVANNFSINNSGTIDAGAGNQGSGIGLEIGALTNATITNTGVIQGRTNLPAVSGSSGASGDGLRLANFGPLGPGETRSFVGSILNGSGGLISSESNSDTIAGFRVGNNIGFQGTLQNDGAITGPRNGVYFGTGDHTGGIVNNSGTISSDSRALNIDGQGLTVNNTGTIAATGLQRNGTVYVDGTADNFTINNSGSIDASGGAGSGLSVQVGSFDGDVVNGSIQNSGLIEGAGQGSLDAGIRFFTSTAESTFSGNILNLQGGVLTGGENSAAVLFDSETSFDGSLINQGLIDGSVFLNDGDAIFTDISILELEVSSLDEFESVETLGLVAFDGILDISFDDGFIPFVGQTFDLFDFSVSTGQFDEIRADGVVFDTSNLGSQGSLTVLSAVPEPSALAIIGFGSVFILTRRRRRDD